MARNRCTLILLCSLAGTVAFARNAGAELIDLKDKGTADKVQAVLSSFAAEASRVTVDRLQLDTETWLVTVHAQVRTARSESDVGAKSYHSRITLTLDLQGGRTLGEELTIRGQPRDVTVNAETLQAIIENDLAKALTVIPDGGDVRREIRSDYNSARNYYVSHYGRENVYFASREFTRWAAQASSGRWVAEALTSDAPGTGKFMKQAKAQSLRELASVADWLESKGQQDAITVAHQVLSGEEVPQSQVLLKWQPVRYASRLRINGRQVGREFAVDRHAAFVLVWTGDGAQHNLVSSFVSTGRLEDENSRSTRSKVFSGGAGAARRSVELTSLACFRTQDTVGWDEAELRIWVDGKQLPPHIRSMDNGDVWKLNVRLDFAETVRIQLWDRDRRNGNDFIGEATISAGKLTGSEELRQSAGYYRIEWVDADS